MERRERNGIGMIESGDGPTPEASVGLSSATGSLVLLPSFSEACRDIVSCFSPENDEIL